MKMVAHPGKFVCPIREKTETVFRPITTGDVAGRLEKAGLLKALRIERERPIHRAGNSN